jgi:hypothetical protein
MQLSFQPVFSFAFKRLAPAGQAGPAALADSAKISDTAFDLSKGKQRSECLNSVTHDPV